MKQFQICRHQQLNLNIIYNSTKVEEDDSTTFLGIVFLIVEVFAVGSRTLNIFATSWID